MSVVRRTGSALTVDRCGDADTEEGNRDPVPDAVGAVVGDRHDGHTM
ncbi:hypothetical protein Cus16_2079 [Curtobacterium sp. ER1/6]|nr:hypothetical protein Cus16_2079 [Curtobacterium sp. ER1/6]